MPTAVTHALFHHSSSVLQPELVGAGARASHRLGPMRNTRTITTPTVPSGLGRSQKPMSVRATNSSHPVLPFNHRPRNTQHATRFTEGRMMSAIQWPDDESFTHTCYLKHNDHPGILGSVQGQDPDASFPRTMPTVTPPPSRSRPGSPRASMERSHAHRVSFRTSTSPKSGATRNSSVTTNGCGAPAEGESCQICGGGRCRTCGCRSI
jgi:hypothetical protein